jgi:ribonuclease HI
MIDSLDVAIFADESCLGNQFQGRANPGGAAGMMEYWTGDRWVRSDYWIFEPDTTNQRMALRSAIEGLGLLRKSPCRVRFTSDSKYLVDGMKEWVRGWKARNWTRKGGEIKNLDLWKELDRLRENHRVEWNWVRGHAKHPQNEYADHLATTAAKESTSSNGLIESGFGPWLEKQRDRRGRYHDYLELAPPAGPTAGLGRRPS